MALPRVDLSGGMHLPELSVRPPALRWVLALLGLWFLPVSGRCDLPLPSLAEQLAQAQSDKDHDAVVELCRRQLESSPRDAKLLREMFRAQLEVKDFDRAAETLTRLGQVSPPSAWLAEARGDLAQAAGKPLDDALAAWKEALAAGPADVPALLGKSADALADAGRWQEAAEAYHASLRAKPDHAARTMRLAVCLLNAGHPEDADKQALAAGRIDAADKTVKASAPMFDRLRPQLPALRKLDEHIDTGPQGVIPYFQLDRALIYYRAGAYAAALADTEAATKDRGVGAVAARLLEGQCLWWLDREKEAVALRVAKIEDARWFDDPHRCDRLRAPDELTDKADATAVIRAYAARTMLLLAGNQPVLALEDAEMAIRTEEKASRRTADTEVVLAAALLRNDRPADALAAAQRATRDDPRNPDGWALCGRLEQEAAEFPAAVENLSRALAIREEAGWLHRRETCLRVLGRNAEADRDARRAAQLPASS